MILFLSLKRYLQRIKKGKEDRAILMHKKVNVRIEDKIQDKTGVTQKKLSVSRNPYYGMFKWRYQGYNTRWP
jgi:hypothetical protein